MAKRRAKSRKPQPTARPARFDWTWAALLLIIIAVAAIRIRLLNIPLERDEGEFGYMGQLILQGGPLYAAAYNMKLPGIYAAYALILLLFGQSAAGIHLGLMFVNIGAVVLLFVLVRQLFDPFAGVVACASYAVMSLSPCMLGTAAHATHFVVLCALGGLVLLLKAIRTGRWPTLFWSGLLLGLGFTMKQSGVWFVFLGIAYLAWSLTRERPTRWGVAAGKIALLAVSSVIPFGVCCVAAVTMGEFDKFWFWTMKFPSEYGSLPLRQGLIELRPEIGRIIGPNLWLWAVGGVGLTALAWSHRAQAQWAFSVGFLVFSVLSVSSSFYFREHYFILMLPALSLLAGVAVSSAHETLSGAGLPAYLRVAPAAAFLLALGYPMVTQQNVFFVMTPEQVCRFRYFPNPFPEFVQIADYVRKNTEKHDKVAVLGSEAEFYFYARRRAATSYIYVYSLVLPQRYARQMQREMTKQIESAKPKYIVYSRVATSWAMQPKAADLLLNWCNSYVNRHYESVGLADIVSSDQTDYYWDDESYGVEPSSPNYVMIFRRRNL